jgi:hypothetical protein
VCVRERERERARERERVHGPVCALMCVCVCVCVCAWSRLCSYVECVLIYRTFSDIPGEESMVQFVLLHRMCSLKQNAFSCTYELSRRG